MHLRRFAPLALAAVLVAPLRAADGVEIVPTVGLRGGGEFEVVAAGTDSSLDSSAAFGLAVDWPLGAGKWIEVAWSHESSEFHVEGIFPPSESFEMDVDYLHASGVYRPERKTRARPFVGFGAGVTRFGPGPDGFGSEYAFSVVASGGADFALGENVALRLLARGWFSFDEAVFSGVCSGAACSFRISGDGFFQLEGAIGLVLRP